MSTKTKIISSIVGGVLVVGGIGSALAPAEETPAASTKAKVEHKAPAKHERKNGWERKTDAEREQIKRNVEADTDPAKLMRQVRMGMTKSQVKAIAGPAADVTTSQSEFMGETTRLDIWTYGELLKGDAIYSLSFTDGVLDGKTKL